MRSSSGHTAYNPNVFFKPSGLTQTLLYRASLRIPMFALPGAKGKPTPEYIRVSTADAGELRMSYDQNGNAIWSVALHDKLQER